MEKDRRDTPAAKFCKHGVGIDVTCIDCGKYRKGVHDVPWDEEQQAFVWPRLRTRGPIYGDPQEPPDVPQAEEGLPPNED